MNPAGEEPGAGGKTDSESSDINWKTEGDHHTSFSTPKENLGEKGNFITREEDV